MTQATWFKQTTISVCGTAVLLFNVCAFDSLVTWSRLSVIVHIEFQCTIILIWLNIDHTKLIRIKFELSACQVCFVIVKFVHWSSRAISFICAVWLYNVTRSWTFLLSQYLFRSLRERGQKQLLLLSHFKKKWTRN